MANAFKIAGVGELLYDVLPAGKQLGGAPVNFAFHAQRLGLDAYLVSSVGKDADGRSIINELARAGLSTKYVQQANFPTGTAQVFLDEDGTPHFTISENAAWDHIQWTDELSILATQVDAVCFGSLAQRSPCSCESIWQFLQHTRKDCLRIFDINLRQNYYSRDIIELSLQSANVVKLNDDELQVLKGLLDLPKSPNRALSALRDRYTLKYVALTRGAEGSMLMDDHTCRDCLGFPATVVDTVGAGDSFTAFLAYGILHQLPLDRINRLANQLAAYVCSQAGATPVLSDSLVTELTQDVLLSPPDRLRTSL